MRVEKKVDKIYWTDGYHGKPARFVFTKQARTVIKAEHRLLSGSTVPR